MAALDQVIALQDEWYSEHGTYCGTYDLEGQFDGNILDDDYFPQSGGTIRQFLSVDGQSYILLARNLNNWKYITATNRGDLYHGWAYDQVAYAAISALAWAQNAMFAKSSHYGSLHDLYNEGVLGEDWLPYMETDRGEVALLESGTVVTLTRYSHGPDYSIEVEGGSCNLEASFESSSVYRTQLDDDYEKLRLEKARNSLRTVVSASAANYVQFREYSTLPVMVERMYLPPIFGENDPADLRNGIRMFVVVAEGGQAYDAVSAVAGVMYYGSESGDIHEYSLDEPVDDPEIEALRIRAKPLTDNTQE